MSQCTECGMDCQPNEYHPYAACLMFKGCHNSAAVRANLAAQTADHSEQALNMVAPDHIGDDNKMVAEPFGYFRSTLDGWIDCAETDEGARPLYEYAEIEKRDAVIEFQRKTLERIEQSDLPALRAQLASYEAAPRAGVDGWQLVSTEISDAMSIAGGEAFFDATGRGESCTLNDQCHAETIFRAMLEAAAPAEGARK